jgi:23S rRNA U2552 (ribose-2'-O)-methylase RlmE/FtsJ
MTMRALQPIKWARYAQVGYRFAQRPWKRPTGNVREPDNPLRSYFLSNKSGPGIFKWDHYFEIYHRHLARFVNSECRVMEIGVDSGGSLRMWRNYFGAKANIYGVDIEPDCKVYEREGVKIFIGDQADRSFWRKVKEEVPHLDILIDDGGHSAHQQMVTLEELLPHLSPGGVYICEDVHGRGNTFLFYIAGLTSQLYETKLIDDLRNSERRLSSPVNDFQASVQSIHHYPFVTVIEKRERGLPEFVAPKRGTEWRPR